MHKPLFLIMLFSVFINALDIKPTTSIVSNYIFRGISQTQDTPSINTKIIIKQSGLHIGAWASRVTFDTNNTYAINQKILNANTQVDIFAGYEAQLGSSSLGIGYIDRRYILDRNLESNISSEYYVFINFKSNINTIIKVSYDVLNLLDPFVAEISFQERAGAVKLYTTYGRHIKSQKNYWKIGVNNNLSYFKMKGSLSLTYSKFNPVIGTENAKFIIGYSF